MKRRRLYQLNRRIGQAMFALFAFVCLGMSEAFAQNPVEVPDPSLVFEHYSTQDGLSQSIETAIAQDQQSFIWIGTEDGLNKYDGIRISIYRNDFSDNSTISDNWVRGITLDQDGDLWIATHNGLSRYNSEQDNFTQFRRDPNNANSVGSNYLLSICEYKGDIWVGTGDEGISRYNKRTRTFRHYKHNPNKARSLPNNEVKVMHVDHSNNLWIGTNNGLCRYDERMDEFVIYRGDINPRYSISGTEIRAIYEDSNNILWVGTGSSGVSRFNENRTEVVNYAGNLMVPEMMRSGGVNTIYEDDTKTLWIGTTQGLLKRDPGEWKFKIAKNSLSEPKSLSNNDVSAVFEDRSRMLWVGTRGGGLNIYDVHRKKFVSYKHDYKNPGSLAKDVVRALYEDRAGYLWVGLREGGLDRFDPKTGTFAHFPHSPKNPTGLWAETVSAIHEDKFGGLWVGSWGEGLNWMDAQTGKCDHYVANGHAGSLPDNRIQAIMEDQEGELWVATDGGFCKFDRQSNSFTTYSHDPSNANSLSNNAIQSKAFIQDDDGIFWIGTYSGGLNKFEQKTGKFTRYTHNANAKLESLPDKGIISLLSQNDVLWIGTDGGGLARFNKYSGKVRTYTRADGLPSDVIYSIMADAQGNLWMSTKNGLCKFNPSKESFKSYYDYHGIQSNVFYWGAACKGRTGMLYVGGINGLTMFRPEEIEDNNFVPPVLITEFRINNVEVPIGNMHDGRQLLWKHISATQTLELDHTDRFFSFGFAALNFSHPERNQYKYKMEGFDEDWRITDAKNPHAPYTNLPDGNYTFKVMGANNDGLWSSEVATIEIEMRPPWWGTIWAKLLALAVVGGTTYLYYLNRLKRLSKQKRELQEQVRMRTAELVSKTKELEAQQERIVKQNEKIQSSINYAQRIQTALMPIKKEFSEAFYEYFIFFKPRDVVSGDFYWMAERDNKILVAAVDCTGHGVPGAFMSMIGIDLLKETVNTKGITDPSEILSELHHGVRSALHQAENKSRDGMDMACCCFERQPSGYIRMDYAGAHNPLVYIKDGEVHMLKATKLGIGGIEISTNAIERKYERQSIEIDGPTMIYMYSDGFQDQFGGDDGRKLMSKNFKQLLLDIHVLPANEQKDRLDTFFRQWKGDREQTDDVLVMGFRIGTDIDQWRREHGLTGDARIPDFLNHR